MLTKNQINELRTLLKNSENPLFFFDDDPDGLCSFLLLCKKFQKGKGIIVKTSPKLEPTFVQKVKKYSPDLVIILDKPIITQEFVNKVNVPIIWVDHHKPVKVKGVKYYNPILNNKNDNRPVTYWCYKITDQDLWIATIGTISDWSIPKFAKEFSKKYPDILPKNIKTQEQVLFETKLGTLIRIFSFVLKGKISQVNKCIKYLLSINTPYEILNQETQKGKFIYQRYLKINKSYKELLREALKIKPKNKLLIFIYHSNKISFTSDLASELLYKNPSKLVIVGREKNNQLRLSLRSKNIILPKIIEKALKNIPGYGGGHNFACGTYIKKQDLQDFINNIQKQIQNGKN